MQFSSIVFVLAAVAMAVSAIKPYYPDWKDSYFVWANDTMGDANVTFGDVRAARTASLLTAVAAYKAAFGYPGNPGTINKYFSENGLYTESLKITIYYSDTDKVGYSKYLSSSTSSRFNNVRDAFDKNQGIVLKLHGCNIDPFFYVLVVGYDDAHQAYYVHDPTGCLDWNPVVMHSDVVQFLYFTFQV